MRAAAPAGVGDFYLAPSLERPAAAVRARAWEDAARPFGRGAVGRPASLLAVSVALATAPSRIATARLGLRSALSGHP